MLNGGFIKVKTDSRAWILFLTSLGITIRVDNTSPLPTQIKVKKRVNNKKDNTLNLKNTGN